MPPTSPLLSVPVLPWGPGTGVEVLGIPVCHPEEDDFARKIWDRRVDKALSTLRVLQALPEGHVQYTLLRFCLSACKVMDLFSAKSRRWLLYSRVPLNHASILREPLAKQKAAPSRNGVEGRNGSATPTQPSAWP